MYQRLLNALAAGRNPDLERWMYNRAGSTVTEIWSSQAIYISQAAAVAKVIQEAAKAAKQRRHAFCKKRLSRSTC